MVRRCEYDIDHPRDDMGNCLLDEHDSVPQAIFVSRAMIDIAAIAKPMA